MNFKARAIGAVMVCSSAGCIAGDIGSGPDSESDASAEEELSAGVNGSACFASPYNCKLRANGGARVATADPADDTWGVAVGRDLVDGFGTKLGTSTSTRITFNWGQVRTFGGQKHAFAMSSSNGSTAWYPISGIAGKTSFLEKVGAVHAHDPGQGKMACYQIKNTHDPVLELLKVNYDTTALHERAGDYLPLVRKNGKRSANLTFNVPGHALGGVAIDHYPAGTRFQRVVVPTHGGAPSLDVPLWDKDKQGRYRKPAGALKFVYGYIVAGGAKRFGWMAYPALEKASSCP
jgi:hypothetical protein